MSSSPNPYQLANLRLPTAQANVHRFTADVAQLTALAATDDALAAQQLRTANTNLATAQTVLAGIEAQVAALTLPQRAATLRRPWDREYLRRQFVETVAAIDRGIAELNRRIPLEPDNAALLARELASLTTSRVAAQQKVNDLPTVWAA